MVRLWILAFNSGGIDALASKPRPGRPRKVKLERVRASARAGAGRTGKAGQRHWTGVKLHGWLKEQLCLELGYCTLIRYLHQLDYNLRVPQRWPERQDEAERKAFLSAWRSCGRFPDRTVVWRRVRGGRRSATAPALDGTRQPPARALLRRSHPGQCSGRSLPCHRPQFRHGLRRDEYRLLPVFFGLIGPGHSSRTGQTPSPFHR